MDSPFVGMNVLQMRRAMSILTLLQSPSLYQSKISTKMIAFTCTLKEVLWAGFLSTPEEKKCFLSVGDAGLH